MGLALGLIADVDMEGESLRCLGGELRNAIYGVIRVVFLRKYDIEISYPGSCACNENSPSDRRQEFKGSGDPAANRSKFGTFHMPPINSDVPTDWVTIRGKHVLVLATFTTHMATNILAQRGCGLDSGKILLNLHGRDTTRRDCLKVWDFVERGLGVYDADHQAQCVGKTIECNAFRIVPKGRRHPITIDGELLPFGPVQGWVLPGIARIMCSKS